MFSPTSAPGTTVFKMAAVHRLEFVKNIISNLEIRLVGGRSHMVFHLLNLGNLPVFPHHVEIYVLTQI